MFTGRQAFFAALCVSALAGAQAGDIYRWVDAQGQTHFADVVPEKYKAAATRIDSGQHELTTEQQHEAAASADQERANTRDLPKPRTAGASSRVTPAASALQNVIKRPIQAVTESTDCGTRWRLFRESEACFGPFNTVGGGIKPEAFDYCNEIQSPALKCGPERN